MKRYVKIGIDPSRLKPFLDNGDGDYTGYALAIAGHLLGPYDTKQIVSMGAAAARELEIMWLDSDIDKKLYDGRAKVQPGPKFDLPDTSAKPKGMN